MNHDKPTFECDPSEILLKELTIRSLTEQELPQAQKYFEQEHYLGKATRVGNELFQAVEYKGQWVALLEWGCGMLKLSDRDEWIGWNGLQRAQRLGLIANNRRFLVLSKTRMPNLASKALALAVKNLPMQWEERFGYRPLLAETFTDIEMFEGTCYKASGWTPCGLTKGFERHRQDYYQEHHRPKKLWLKSLNRNSRRILCSIDLPAQYEKGANVDTPDRSLPLKKPQLDSLIEYLREHFKDPRRNNRSYTCSSLLALIFMGLLSGRKCLAEIQRSGRFLSEKQRTWFNFPLKKAKQTHSIPSYSALYKLLTKIDPHAFAKTCSEWLQLNEGDLPKSLAVDGKYISDKVLTVCLCDHETGAPIAIGIADKAPKTDTNKKEGEQTVARKLFKQANLTNALISGDAGFCNQNDSRIIVENGADYFLQLKDERKDAFKEVQRLEASLPLFRQTQ